MVAFELSQVRALLLIFPNTFEYFFIAYEAIRARWRTTRWGLRWWIGVAAFIWIFIKLPQEWWIHVAQLDFTDFLADHAWAGPTIVVLLLAAFGAFWVWGRPRLLPADHTWRFAADPLPEELETMRRAVARVRRQRCRLVGRDPREGGPSRPALGHLRADAPGRGCLEPRAVRRLVAVVVVNAAFTLALARRSRTLQSIALAFVARTVANVALVAVAAWLVHGQAAEIDAGATLFFLTMISLLTTLHDRWYPVMESRVASSDEGTGVAPVTS